MYKILKSLKRFFGFQRYRFYIAIITTDKTILPAFAWEEIDRNDITEEYIKKGYEENYALSVKEVNIVNTFTVSQSCAMELINSIDFEKIYTQEVTSNG